jgi:transcriptional regulator
MHRDDAIALGIASTRLQSPLRSLGELRQARGTTMYLPRYFRWDDPHQHLVFMRAHPFATLAAHIDGRLEASRIPLLSDRSDGRFLIHGHISAGNALCRATSGLAMFQGPHAYVSASWYAEADMVPTWSYLEVHASGQITWLEDAEEQYALFQRLGTTFDPQAQAWWNRLSRSAYAAFAARIRWFRLDAAEVLGKAKLNQDDGPEERRRIIAALRSRGGPDDLAIAQAIEQDLARE